MTDPSIEPTIVFLTKDLMIQSNASATAKKLSVKMLAASSVESAIQKLKDSAAIGLLIDLQTPELEVEYLIDTINKLEIELQTVAFAQHVETELLESANCEAIDVVLTRGQFNNRLPSIIQQMAS